MRSERSLRSWSGGCVFFLRKKPSTPSTLEAAAMVDVEDALWVDATATDAIWWVLVVGLVFGWSSFDTLSSGG